jgi:hypothetical protein
MGRGDDFMARQPRCHVIPVKPRVHAFGFQMKRRKKHRDFSLRVGFRQAQRREVKNFRLCIAGPWANLAPLQHADDFSTVSVDKTVKNIPPISLTSPNQSTFCPLPIPQATLSYLKSMSYKIPLIQSQLLTLS